MAFRFDLNPRLFQRFRPRRTAVQFPVELRQPVFPEAASRSGVKFKVILNPPKTYSAEETMLIINRALAYHSALATLFSVSIEEYEEPKVIPNSPHFSADPQLKWIVIVREGHGAVGVKDAWTPQQLKAGKIPVHLGRFYSDEIRMLNSDPSLVVLPRHKERGQSEI